MDAVSELEDQIIAMPAATIEGMRVKARIIARYLRMAPPMAGHGTTEERTAISLAIDLLRGVAA